MLVSFSRSTTGSGGMWSQWGGLHFGRQKRFGMAYTAAAGRMFAFRWKTLSGS